MAAHNTLPRPPDHDAEHQRILLDLTAHPGGVAFLVLAMVVYLHGVRCEEFAGVVEIADIVLVNVF